MAIGNVGGVPIVSIVRSGFREREMTDGVIQKDPDYLKVMKTFQQIILDDPNNAEAYYNLGVAYGELGQYQEAIEALEQAIRIDPNEPDAYYNLGIAYSELEQYQEAIKAFKKSIRLRSDCADVHYQLGTVYVMIEDFGSALKEYRILKKLNPKLAWLLLI